MNLFTKIKAFTISEMMVALLITLIVVGMAFSVLHLTQKQMLGLQRGLERTTSTNLLQQALWIDFSTYSSAVYNAKRKTLYLKNEISHKEYHFTDTHVFREKDTFALRLTAKTFYFNGNEVWHGPIDAMQFTTDSKDGEHTIFVYKTNSANAFIE